APRNFFLFCLRTRLPLDGFLLPVLLCSLRNPPSYGDVFMVNPSYHIGSWVSLFFGSYHCTSYSCRKPVDSDAPPAATPDDHNDFTQMGEAKQCAK
ncbi:MAG: hypothetical protein LBP78_03945, partial [Acidaminococcales bacterium]|nr:hypothetical protein [Acidaminococcales bacterium]